MRMYRLGDRVNADGWPFLFEGQAYLADGTPLTEYDGAGRVVPARKSLGTMAKVCSGGQQTLADRESGVVALARALDKGDAVHAPILLLQLRIDPAPSLEKFNPFHKPDGPGGGQFTNSPFGGGAITPVDWGLDVTYNSTFVPDPNHPEFTLVHEIVKDIVWKAILQITTRTFTPGMPSYGAKLHDTVEAAITALNFPGLSAEPVYLGGKEFEGT